MKAKWNTKRLFEVSVLYDSLHKTPIYVENGYPMIRVTDIRRGYLDTNNTKQVDHETYLEFSKKHKPDIGDIIFSRVGSYGNSSLVSKIEEFCLGQNTVCISPDRNQIDPNFLYHFLNSDSAGHQIDALVGGASQPTISLENINEICIKLPPLFEQRQVASILSAYDDLIENNTRRIKILEEMARLIYREWFAEFKAPGIKLRKATPEEKKVTGKDVFPEGWEVKELGEFIELGYGKGLKAELRIEGTIPVYGSGGIIGFHNEAIVKGPGIIVGRKGNVGSVYWSEVDFFPIDTVFYVRSNTNLQYLYYCLSNLTFINTDAAVPGLNRESALRKKVLLPANSILQEFEKVVMKVFNQLQVLNKMNNNLRQTRDLLLPKLISGEVEV